MVHSVATRIGKRVLSRVIRRELKRRIEIRREGDRFERIDVGDPQGAGFSISVPDTVDSFGDLPL